MLNAVWGAAAAFRFQICWRRVVFVLTVVLGWKWDTQVDLSYLCVTPKNMRGASEVASVSRRKRQRSTFFPQQRCLNVAKQFHLLCDLETDLGIVKPSDLKHMQPRNAAGKSIFMGSYHYFCSQSIRCWAGANSVTSCAKFISESSFVDPAQTIKGAAGMTSAWKIPHMERWKMTCGFLSAEASSAVWQRRREGGWLGRSLVVFLDFSLYIQ